MNKAVYRRILAFCLALSLLASSALAAGGSFSSSESVAEGTTLIRGTEWTESGTVNQSFVFEKTPGGGVSAVVAYGGKLYGKSTISEIKSFLENQGYTVVAGINADFFTIATGLPSGIVVTDGVLRSSDGWQNGVGFLPDGTAIVGKPQLTIQAQYDWGTVPITSINKLRTDAGVYLLTEDFSGSTQVSTDGILVTLKPEMEGDALSIGGTVRTTVESVDWAGSSTPIPAGRFVLTASSAKESLLSGLAVGQTVTLSITCADERWNQVRYAVGGGKLLMQNGSIVAPADKDVNPRTAFGVKADGTLVMVAVDGRQTGVSAGMTLGQLAAKMAELGCVDAINFDGGGSTSAAVSFPGQDSFQMVNVPSDGSPRKCANFVFLVNENPKGGDAARLHFSPAFALTLPGARLSFDMLATDAGWHTAQVPGGLNFWADEALGEAEMGQDGKAVLNVGSAGRTGKLYASGGGAQGETTVTVIETPDTMDVKRDGKTVTALSLEPGESVDLTVAVTYKGRKVTTDDGLFTWTLSNEAVGTVDENGLLTAGASAGTYGTLTVGYGSLTRTVELTVGRAPDLLDNFEKADGFTVTDPAAVAGEDGTFPDTGAFAKLNKDQLSVRYGYGSLMLSYRKDGPAELAFAPAAPYAVAKDGTLSLWVKGDGSGSQFYLNMQNAAGGTEKSAAATLDFTDWKRLDFVVKAGTKILSFGLAPAAGEGSGTVYLDEMRLSYQGALEDVTPPALELVITEGTALLPAYAIVGSAFDESGMLISADEVTLTLDGAALPFSWNAGTGKLSATLDGAALTSGVHRLTMEAWDKAGNRARKSVDFTAAGGEDSGFADMADHWGRTYVDFLAAKGVLTGEVKDDGTTLFNPERPMSRAEMAAVMARYMGYDLTAYEGVELPFIDVSDIPAWALPYVKAAYAGGLMQGRQTKDGVRFAPNAQITRMEAMTLLGRTMPQGYDGAGLQVSDKDKVQTWALPYVVKLINTGVVAGYNDGSIQPEANIKRAEVASILFKLY